MIIYSNGCSHTRGHGINFVKTWPNVVMRGILGNNDYETNPLKNKIKNTNILFNEAESGSGNDYIFHNSLESISELIQKNIKPDYVFIQWSGPNRRIHQDIDEKIYFINPHDNTEMGLKYEPLGSKHTLHYMFLMQEYLKNNNINYLFFNYMPLDESIKRLNIYNQMDFDNFLFTEVDMSILFKGMMEYIIKNNMTYDYVGHPNERGNFVIGNMVLKKLNFNELKYNNFC